ncbi:MAG: amino acid ABC transporter substrate-binding protein [Saprospiraceae bacterium]|nr:amino acid ABC transporter substrate-binding protein [Saprospiraceae bacterium]
MTIQNNEDNKIKNKLHLGGALAALYYIIGVVSYILKGVSFFGSNPHVILIGGITFFFLSLIFGTYILVSVKNQININANLLYFNKWFVIPFLVISILNIIFVSYLIGEGHFKKSPNTNDRTRIVLLFPLGDQIKSSYQDGQRQMLGYVDFLRKTNSLYSSDFDFIFLDHGMSFDNAKRIIEKEVTNGTKYFISTMSAVNVDLSKHFEDIISKCNYEGSRPILICTVTSSPAITIKKNIVYRFYVRSQEEGKVLAEKCNGLNISSGIYIIVDDAYGKGAVDEFKKYWNGEFTVGLKIGFGYGSEKISEQIVNKLKIIPKDANQVIFIAHYGNGIDEIIKAINKVKLNGVIFATSTLSIKDWQEPINEILMSYRWFTCVPNYKTNEDNDDVIRNFTTYTLLKLIQTINLAKEGSNVTFDECWEKSFLDFNMEISTDKGDALIPMKVVDKSYFK